MPSENGKNDRLSNADPAAVNPLSPAGVGPLDVNERAQLLRLQEENQRRTLVLAAAAHELKTPLAVLFGYVELLLNNNLGPLTPKQLQVLMEIEASRNRLQVFIDDFLTYCSLESGKHCMRFRAGDINACLSEICRIWLTRFQTKGLPFYFVPAQGIDFFLFDYYKVQHIISNLLENAWKYTSHPGTVWLSAESYLWERRSYRGTSLTAVDRRAPSRAQLNSVRITVSDTGPAIPPEYHQEVFQEFLRLPHFSGATETGAGLGLAIARRLVHAHGGKIWLESQPDKGNSFCFILPFTPPMQSGDQHEHAA
jgi:signal transduction histidine kinase